MENPLWRPLMGKAERRRRTRKPRALKYTRGRIRTRDITHFKYLVTSIEEECGIETEEITKRGEQAGQMGRNAIQRSTVRQKVASETEVEGLHNCDQASNPIWGRHVGYDEETRKANCDKRDENATMDCRVARKYKIRNEHIRGPTRVTQAALSRSDD